MLTYVACFLSCVIVSAIPTGRVEVVYPSIETLRDGTKSVKLRAFGQDINLKLQPTGKFLYQDFSVIDGAGNELHEPEFDIESFKQKLYRDKRIGASLYIDEDGPLSIYGVVNSKLKIEPQNAIENGKRAHLVVETRKDKNGRFKNKAIPARIMRNETQKVKRSYSNCIVIKYVFITESTFTESFPRRNGITLTKYLDASVQRIQELMDNSDLNIEINLYGIIKLTRETEQYLAPYIKESEISGDTECLDASKLLDKMADYYSIIKYSIITNCDIAILITGRKLCSVLDGIILGPVASASFTGGVCQELRKFGVLQDDKYKFEREDTISHESAHLLGCPHDGEGPVESIENSPGSEECFKSGSIMDTGSPKTNPNSLSPCCVRNIENMLTLERTSCIKGECLVNDY